MLSSNVYSLKFPLTTCFITIKNISVLYWCYNFHNDNKMVYWASHREYFKGGFDRKLNHVATIENGQGCDLKKIETCRFQGCDRNPDRKQFVTIVPGLRIEIATVIATLVTALVATWSSPLFQNVSVFRNCNGNPVQNPVCNPYHNHRKKTRVANFRTFRFRFRCATRVAISIRNPGTVVTIRVSTRVAILICNPKTVVSARVSTRVLILIWNPWNVLERRFRPGLRFGSQPWIATKFWITTKF